MATAHESMDGAVFHGRGDVRLESLPVPVLGPRDVLVKVGACGICGTDLTPYRVGRGDVIKPGSRIGHEFMGSVARVGSDVVGIREGMRVAVNPITAQANPWEADICGGFAEFKKVENAALGYNLLPLPDAVTDAAGALLEPLSVARHATLMMQADAARALVLGAGPIGLGTLALLKLQGVEDVAVADVSAYRRQRALELGASRVIDPAAEDLMQALAEQHGRVRDEVAGGPATDVIFDLAGSVDALNTVVRGARRGAQIVVVALYNRPVPVDLLQLVYRQISITGSVAYDFASDFRCVADLIAERALNVEPILSHRFPLAQVSEAFQLAADSASAAKVIVEMQG